MRRQSQKRQKLCDEMGPLREAFKIRFHTCWRCLQNPSSDCHEITRGPYREKALRVPALWMALCRGCHDKMGDTRVWPIERQLALKLIRDPLGFDLEAVQQVLERPTPIVLADVVVYLDVMEDGFENWMYY